MTDVLAGSNPMRWARKRKASSDGGLAIQWWAMRDVRVRLRRPPSLRRFAPRVLRWKTLRVSSAPHPCGFEAHAPGTKKKGLHHWRPNNSMVGDEGCPRAAGAARAPLRRSAPRVLRWKTLARFLSSAPLRVRIPCAGHKQKRSPCEDRFKFSGGR